MTHRPQSAFTLIELLIVIGIISVLAGMVIAGLGLAANAGKKAKTAATIANVGAAIERYRTSTGAIPETHRLDELGLSEPKRKLLSSDHNPDIQQRLNASSADMEYDVTPRNSDSATLVPMAALRNNTRLLSILRTVDSESFGPHSDAVKDAQPVDNATPVSSGGAELPAIVDAWGKPLIYRPYICYPLIEDHKSPVHSAEPPNPDTYQVWSVGPDLLNDDAIENTDDLKNW